MVWAYGTHRGKERCIHGFGGEIWREEDNLEDLDVDDKTVLKLIFKEQDWGMDWIDLIQEMASESSCESGYETLGSVPCGEFLTSWEVNDVTIRTAPRN